MPEQVRCPSCQAALRVPEALVGKNVKCPKCHTAFIAEVEELAHPRGIVREPTPAVQRPQLRADDDKEEYPPEEESEEERPRRGRRRRRRSLSAESAVTGPAIAMMIAAVLGLACNLGYLVFRVIVLVTLDRQMVQNNTPGFQASYTFGLTSTIAGSLLGMVLCALTVFGAAKMKNLSGYGWALTASILSLLPCNWCCLLGLPFGIWGLVVLNYPEVKDAFS
jgi:predicted Zn finger-like uncharacterized protein